jgi:hypothetical protein
MVDRKLTEEVVTKIIASVITTVTRAVYLFYTIPTMELEMRFTYFENNKLENHVPQYPFETMENSLKKYVEKLPVVSKKSYDEYVGNRRKRELIINDDKSTKTTTWIDKIICGASKFVIHERPLELKLTLKDERPLSNEEIALVSKKWEPNYTRFKVTNRYELEKGIYVEFSRVIVNNDKTNVTYEIEVELERDNLSWNLATQQNEEEMRKYEVVAGNFMRLVMSLQGFKLPLSIREV